MPAKTQKAAKVLGQIAVDWKIKTPGKDAKTVPLNKYINFLEEKGYDTEKLEEKVESKLRSHVKKSKYTVEGVDPTLEFVDVSFKGDPPNPPELEFSVGLKSVKAEDSPSGQKLAALKFSLLGTFDRLAHGGGRTRRRRRA